MDEKLKLSEIEGLVSVTKESVDNFIHKLIVDKPDNPQPDQWNQGFNHGWKNALATLNKELLSLADEQSSRQIEVGLDREKVAKYAHIAWSGWIKYMFSKCQATPDQTLIIPKWAVERWSKQATTEYEDLTNEEKESDLKEADALLNAEGIVKVKAVSP